MMPKNPRPKVSLLHDEIPEHMKEFMQLTRLAEMGRMAASLAHEINTPLAIVQGFAENLELLLAREDVSREQMRVQALEIIKGCQRMTRIITKMNRMSRHQKLRLHVVDLAEVSLNAVDFLKTQISAHDVRLEFDFNRPMPIKCDVVQVEQIVLNVLSNALGALGDVEEDRRIRISFEEVGPWQQIKIWNNGPPIPPEIQDKIMAPFFSTKDGEGSGLGLAVSKAIMEVHGGDLSFSSSDGLGTEFILSFPRPETHPWQERARADQGAIVIVDKQVNYRRTLAEKFRLLGFKVAEHDDHFAAIEAIRGGLAISGLMIDLVPGHRQSFEIVKELRQHCGPDALIYALSHFPSARDLKMDLKTAGASESFEKPIHAENFDLILKQLDARALAAPIKTTG